jgi:hypothetical protein
MAYPVETVICRGIRRLRMLRISSWFLLVALFALSVVPASLRPVVAPQAIEHMIAFAAAGVFFSFAHQFALPALMLLAVGYSSLVEMVQLFVPGRHARLSDLMVDGAATLVGAGVGYTLRQIATRRGAAGQVRNRNRD